MIRGIDVNQRIEFVSQYDTDDPKTVFVFRPLTGEEKNNLFAGDDKVKLVGTQLFDLLAVCIVEVRNFGTDGTVREKLSSIKDQRVIAELVAQAAQINGMTEQDAKNS